MPIKARELSDLEVRRLVHPGNRSNVTYAVGGVAGLILQITPTHARSWLLRAVVGNKRREIGLGGYPDVPLAQARERARDAREAIWSGQDPVEDRKVSKAALVAFQKRSLNFEDAMERFLESKLAEFDSAKYRKQYRATLDRYAIPALGGMLVSDISVSDIQRTLEPIWATKTETAKRLRGRIELVLTWATVAGHRNGDNPARWRGNLDAILPKPSKISKLQHLPALALKDAAGWFADLRAHTGVATRALEFAAMTAARSGEVRGATWAEVDRDARLWIVPAERMKTRREHRIPLTKLMVMLLSELPRMQGSEYLFPAVRGGMLSDAALSACMRRIHMAHAIGYFDRRSKRPAVPHGLRSTFRDWAAERTEYPREMPEIALSHSVGSEVERTYLRSDMIDKRRVMMDAWGQFLAASKFPKWCASMGSRGPNAPRTHLTASGWANVNAPSNRREEIEETIGFSLSDVPWTKINRAFRHLNLQRDHQAALAITGKVRNSYLPSLRRSEKRIEKALAELQNQKRELKVNKVIEKSQWRLFRSDLESAITVVKELKNAIQNAQNPEPIEYLSEADAKALVVQEIAEAVRGEIKVDAPLMFRKKKRIH